MEIFDKLMKLFMCTILMRKYQPNHAQQFHLHDWYSAFHHTMNTKNHDFEIFMLSYDIDQQKKESNISLVNKMNDSHSKVGGYSWPDIESMLLTSIQGMLRRWLLLSFSYSLFIYLSLSISLFHSLYHCFSLLPPFAL